MRFSSSQTTTTSTASWIRKAWAPDKSVGPKNSLAITFALIIDRVRPMELQMLYHDTLSEMPKKKLPSEPKTPRFCTGYSPPWPTFWPFLRHPFSPPPDPRLRNGYSASIAAVLGLLPRRSNQRGPLQCQYRSHEAKTPRPVRRRRSGKETAGYRTSWRMGRHRGSAPVWRPPLHSWNHSIGVDQSTSRQSYCSLFCDW